MSDADFIPSESETNVKRAPEPLPGWFAFSQVIGRDRALGEEGWSGLPVAAARLPAVKTVAEWQGYCVVAFPLVGVGFPVITAVVGFPGGLGDVGGAVDTVVPD